MRQRFSCLESPIFGLSRRRKCLALGVNRSWLYYQPKAIDNHDVTVMNEIGDIYAKRPFQGYKRITDDLQELGYRMNHKRTYRLMKLMGLQALYAQKNLSKRRHQDLIFPYLRTIHQRSLMTAGVLI